MSASCVVRNVHPDVVPMEVEFSGHMNDCVRCDEGAVTKD